MKLLISSMNFTPEEIGVGKYSGEMAIWLARAGHDVRVISAQPYYPFWKVFNGYSAFSYSRELIPVNFTENETTNCGSLTVYRCPVWVPKNPSGIKRLIHLLSFTIASLPIFFFQCKWRPTVVIAIEPPLLCAPLAVMLSKLASSKSVLHIHDYEVDAAFNLGLLRGKYFYEFALKVELYLMRKFDLVTSISSKMINKLVRKGVSDDAVRLFPNWVDLDLIKPASNNRDSKRVMREELGLPHDCIIALYSGNMGNKQGLEVLSMAALELINENIFFIFCGNGTGRMELQSACKNLTNVLFLPLQPLAKFNQLLSIADIHLLPQCDGIADFVMPSKLMGILASGRPVVATARADTEVGEIVSSCGLLVEPGDSFSEAIRSLLIDEALRIRLGRDARLYAEKHFSFQKIMLRFEQYLEDLAFKA